MPSRWQLHLSIAPERLAMHHLHGAVSRWLGHTDVGVSDFSLGWPQVISENVTRVEIRLHRDERSLVDRLVDGVHEMGKRGGLRLGPEGRQRKVPLLSPRTGVPLGALSLVQALSWEELRETAVPVNEFTMFFLSPFFTRHGREQVPVPVAGSIVRSLGDRWRAMAPASAPQVSADVLRLEMDEMRGKTVHVELNGVVYRGFVGEATYLSHSTDREQHLDLGRLLAAAPYIGVGSSTAYGFGTVEVA